MATRRLIAVEDANGNLTRMSQVVEGCEKHSEHEWAKIGSEITDAILNRPNPHGDLLSGEDLLCLISAHLIKRGVLPSFDFKSVFGKKQRFTSYAERRLYRTMNEPRGFRMVINIDNHSRYCPDVSDEHCYFDNSDDADYYDDELGYFGIVVKETEPPCPYNEKGEYVPRSKRKRR